MIERSLDIELINRMRQDDTAAFREVFEKYWEQLFAATLKRLESQQLSEDIVQEVFADIWKRRKTLKIKTNFQSYLHTAVKYHVYKAIDQRKWDGSLERIHQSHLGSRSNEVEFDELFDQLEVALEKLPERQQLIFKMSRFEGLKCKEIAEKLQLSQQTVHNNLHKSLSVLRVELKDYAPLLFLILVAAN
ncbi:RNA polymerase sigma-70 factor [Echinicola sp. CAU 1574]|uniref:RNA polymerase sigma-70 factor n=1 Tax=Echinicola arenosa TaxID=2774144 RepID=A0ABR9AIZ1_9BACT|nr:RNA polymerase sigma-70 factor [Echinicola arenosa]MBD8487818.1 RNA polymerase sigma-70 factor [Echinicola arenosa]